jgi:lipoprotein-releasing system ATP-binding protein
MLLELKNISKVYVRPGTEIKNEVFNDISLQIEIGETIAIVGPSGSGKSTLLNIMGSLDKPSSGSVIFNGSDITSYNDIQMAQFRNLQIGFVFQLHHLLPQLNLLENVLLPVLPQKDKSRQQAAKERAMQLIERVGLKDQIYQRPSQLSGGECQRTALVRALINQPKLLLADEPTGSLDHENAVEMIKLLMEINKEQGVAIVLVTHSLELAGKMQKVFTLRNGKLQMLESK